MAPKTASTASSATAAIVSLRITNDMTPLMERLAATSATAGPGASRAAVAALPPPPARYAVKEEVK